MAPSKKHYRVKTTGGRHSTYTTEQIDFLVAYLFPEDSWYVFPVALVENRQVLVIRPGHQKSRYERYRDAWQLMWPAEPDLLAAEMPVSS
jgi:hypothetical protein